MSVHSFKLLDFPATAAQNPTTIPSSKIAAAGLLTVVNANSTSTVAIGQNNHAKRDMSNFHSPIKRGQALLGISLTLALHLLWFFTAPGTEKQEVVTPPQPIMVEWLSNSQFHAEPVKPQSQPTPKIVKPAVKPKVQPRKVAGIPPKSVIAATSTTAESTIVQPVEAPPAPAAVATANPAPAATSASPNSTADDAPVTLPHLNADYLNNPAPNYPPASRELGEQGRVLLRAMINIDGTVAQVVLRKSSGFDRLDQAAMDTVKNWRFVSAQRGEQKVSAWVVVPVAFSLEG